MLEKSSSAFRTISEVAAELDVPKHVLRFWEGKFPQLRPMKRGGGRRYYRPEDIELLRGIRWLLYSDGYTIKGVQRILRDNGVKFVKHCWRDQPPAADTERSFEIPNLAGDAAKAASRPVRVPDRVAPAAAAPAKSRDEVPVRPVQPPAGGSDQKEFLLSLLSELEECRELLQSAVEQQAAAAKPKRTSKRSAAGK